MLNSKLKQFTQGAGELGFKQAKILKWLPPSKATFY